MWMGQKGRKEIVCTVSQIWRWRDGTKWRRDYLNEGRDGNERRRPPAEAIFDRTLSA